MSAAPADLQPSLFDVVLQPIVRAPSGKDRSAQTMAERFQDFHSANPQIYVLLCELALRRKRRGRKHWSINGAFEVLRYEYDLHVVGEEEFKLNNNHRAFYARMLMANEPELQGFFETRGEDNEVLPCSSE